MYTILLIQIDRPASRGLTELRHLLPGFTEVHEPDTASVTFRSRIRKHRLGTHLGLRNALETYASQLCTEFTGQPPRHVAARPELPPGGTPFASGIQGIHAATAVIRLAQDYGMPDEEARRVSALSPGEASDHEHLAELAEDAGKYLNHFAPPGTSYGVNDWQDWGCWPDEDHEETPA